MERSIQARIRKADDENIALTTTILDLSLELDSKDKHHNRQILGYKSQIAQHNAVITDLRKKLAVLHNVETNPNFEGWTFMGLFKSYLNAQGNNNFLHIKINYLQEQIKKLKEEKAQILDLLDKPAQISR